MPSAAGRLPASAAPPQSRGRSRKAHIVGAASDLVDAVGSSDRRPVTLQAIADAAEVPAASIYHYFPDVGSVLAAVAARYGDELLSTVESALAEHDGSVDGLLDTVVTTFRAFFAARPGLRELWFDRRASDEVVELHRGYRAELTSALHERIQGVPAGPGEALPDAILMEMSGRLWELAFQLDPAGHPRVVAELREVSRRFFRRRLGVELRPSDDRAGATARPSAGPCPSDADDLPAEHFPLSVWEPRLPPQERGRRRRSHILSAAATIIDTHGPRGAEVTIRSIADAAGTSPASIYHYFDDLEALVAAVAHEYMADLVAISAEEDTLAETMSFDQLYERRVDAYREFFAARPGVRELWFDRRGSSRVQAMHAYYRRFLAERHRRTAAHYLRDPGSSFDHMMHIEELSSLWDLAFQWDRHGHPLVIQAIRDLGRDHMDRLLER